MTTTTPEHETPTGAPTPKDPIPPDKRTLAEMPFAGFEDITPELVRAILAAAGVIFALDINEVGCSGLYGSGCDTKTINKVRVAMGGGGVGLPCFVPPTRFCLAHNTIGGLMSGQKQFHEQYVGHVSRELTPQEKGHSKLIEAAQHARSEDRRDVLEMLAGYKLPPGFGEMTEEDQEAAMDAAALPPSARREVVARLEAGEECSAFTPNFSPADWKCPEHTKTEWSCRYCVAQAIVEGPLEPTYTLTYDGPEDDNVGLSPAEAEARIAELNEAKFDVVDVYAQVFRLERKLSR